MPEGVAAFGAGHAPDEDAATAAAENAEKADGGNCNGIPFLSNIFLI